MTSKESARIPVAGMEWWFIPGLSSGISRGWRRLLHGETCSASAYVGTIISEVGFLNLLAALKTIRSQVPRKVILEFFGGRNYRNRPWFDRLG